MTAGAGLGMFPGMMISAPIQFAQPLTLAVTAADPASGWLILAIVGGFAVVFPIFWCGIVWFLSHAGGWQRLAQIYRADDRPVSGEHHSGVLGMVGWVSYRYVLTLHFNRDGFFMEVMPLFRIGHPRLFIPWAAVSARKPYLMLFWKAVQLHIGTPVIAKIVLPAKLMANAPTASRPADE